jgi:hypothetical protein
MAVALPLATCLSLAAPVGAVPVSIDLSGNCTSGCGLDGSDGNARVFSFVDGLGLASRVRVTAWSASQSVLTGSLSNWRTAFVGEYDGGLGVTNRDEGSGESNNSHVVDNISGVDFLLFRFDDNVTVTGADLNAFAVSASGYWGSGKDTDASFYIGTTSVPFATSINMADTAQRLSAMANYIETSGPGADNFREFNTGTRYVGNTLMIAASLSEANRWGLDRPDAFKVESIRVEYPIPTPEPAALGLFGLGIAAIGLRRRRRRR